jgi:hypothetical protein
MRRWWAAGLLACLLVALMGFADLDRAAAKKKKKKPARLPVRVAVLPFALKVKRPADPLQIQATRMLREQFFNRFAALSYLDLDIVEVDRRLQAANVSLEEAAKADAPMGLATLLGVDGLVVGRVSKVSTFKGGIITQARLDGTIKLVMSDGEVVWEKDHSESKHGGLLLRGGELVRALEDLGSQFKDERLVTYLKLAEEFSRKVVSEMPEPTREGQDVVAPKIHRVEAQAETARVIKAGGRVRVAAYGDPGMMGTFDLGGWRTGLPLVEASPGRYVGSYTVQAGDAAQAVAVTVRLADAFGLSSTARVSGPALTVDAAPPPAPERVVAEALPGQGVVVRWRSGPEASGHALYRSCPSGGELTLVARITEGASFTDRAVPHSAALCSYQVVAFDAHENLSYPAVAAWRR